MLEHEVVIIGGGPVGRMLAGELALAGVDVAVVERRPGWELAGSRAGGLHARALELLDQRGIAERFLEAGEVHGAAYSGSAMLDLSDFPTRHPYVLALFQNHIERLLAQWTQELRVNVHHGREFVGFSEDQAGVTATLADGERLRAHYLVGCDGGRSLTRKLAGIEFPGWAPTMSSLIAEVQSTTEPEPGIRHDQRGVHAMHRMQDGRTVRIVTTEPRLQGGAQPTLAELRAALVEVYGHDFGVHDPTWISRFTDATRQAASYRAGRVLIAGDAAHIHHPVGGQGLSLGLQDAVNLGWKLAQVVAGTCAEDLLDTYQAERHPVTARSLRHTMARSVLLRPDERMVALRETLDELLAMEEPRRHLAGLLSGLDVRYELGDGHPLLGRRVPDLELQHRRGPLRLFSLLHQARPLLLNLGSPGSLGAGEWATRVELVEATYSGRWELPVIGSVPAPEALLVRPDGHVAWVGDGGAAGLREALGAWFGPQSGSVRAPSSCA